MACIQPQLEKRPLKRPRLGPPDYYPQETRQSEVKINKKFLTFFFGFLTEILLIMQDDLTPDKLRNGYCYRPPFANEYESAKQPRLEEKLDEYCTKVG